MTISPVYTKEGDGEDDEDDKEATAMSLLQGVPTMCPVYGLVMLLYFHDDLVVGVPHYCCPSGEYYNPD